MQSSRQLKHAVQNDAYGHQDRNPRTDEIYYEEELADTEHCFIHESVSEIGANQLV